MGGSRHDWGVPDPCAIAQHWPVCANPPQSFVKANLLLGLPQRTDAARGSMAQVFDPSEPSPEMRRIGHARTDSRWICPEPHKMRRRDLTLASFRHSMQS
jgi:hypothetical protein